MHAGCHVRPAQSIQPNRFGESLGATIIMDLSVNQALDLACMVQRVGGIPVLETGRPPPHLVTIDAE
jgi:hypothetical protein